AGAHLRLPDQAVPGRAPAEGGDALPGGPRAAAAVRGGAARDPRGDNPRTAQGAGPDVGTDGAADERVAGLPVADRAGQELGFDRDALPDRAGAARARGGSVPGDSAFDVAVDGRCGGRMRSPRVATPRAFL